MPDSTAPAGGLVVIVPSRGRPQAALEVAEAFDDTCTDRATRLVFAVDETDPVRHEYASALGARASITFTRSTTMVEALNEAALQQANEAYAVGFMGDDHRPRTVGWDSAYLEALRALGTGMVYGDDLLQRQNLPTQIAMTADIVEELGWMAPPGLVHLAVDNWWLELGRRAGCIRYLPEVVVEHLHPVAGKALWDDGHIRVNAPSMYDRDLAMLARLQATELPGAVARVRALQRAHRTAV